MKQYEEPSEILIIKLKNGDTIITDVPSVNEFSLELSYPVLVKDVIDDKDTSKMSIYKAYTPWLHGSEDHYTVISMNDVLCVSKPSIDMEEYYVDMVLKLMDEYQDDNNLVANIDYLKEVLKRRQNYLN